MRPSESFPRKPAGKRANRNQFAALPYRMARGRLEILLVTSRRTKRWIIPKGWPIEGLSPPDSAAREALEEAGVSGEVGENSVGQFHYFKRLKNGATIPCDVEIFPLKVTRERTVWAEKNSRRRHWYAADEAAATVDEPQLRSLIEEFAADMIGNAVRARVRVGGDGRRKRELG